MEDPSRRKIGSVWEPRSRRRSWCCSFAVPPSSPDNFVVSRSRTTPRIKSEIVAKPSISVPNSPQSSKSGLGLVGRIDPRRILSPGRVSPIDSDPNVERSLQEMGTESSAVVGSIVEPRVESFRAPKEKYRDPPAASFSRSGSIGGCDRKDVFDVRLNLRGKNGGCMVLELNSDALCANSEVFCELILKHKKDLGSNGSPSRSKLCRIEVPEVDNLGVFRDTIELMFEDDISKRLSKIGVYRAIDILEVSAGIMFTKCVASCLMYLEAVPWTEEEEEKLRNLFVKVKFDDATSRDVMARLRLLDSVILQRNIARQLVWSISTCTNSVARNELKALVKALLCKSSVYEKDQDLSKEDLYAVFDTCLASLISLLKGYSDAVCPERCVKNVTEKPLIEQIAMEVDNINWLFEILLDWQMAEKFVNIWADQKELIRMHENTSPMVRYELSRVSANLFIAMGTRKLNCRSESRSGLLQTWFGPMLVDFGWLQRCKKGLDTKMLEEAMGQTLLTLPMKQQHLLFMDWCRFFSKCGTECPNLSKAFQIWWRRSFLRGSETYSIESR